MTISIRTASGIHGTKWSLRTAAGLRSVAQISLRTASGIHTVYSAAGSTGALTPDYVAGYGYSKGPTPVVTDQATVNAPAGATIVWNFGTAGWTATNPSGATSSFRKTVAAGVTNATTVTATVTVNGSTYTTNAISASVTNDFGS